MNVVIELLLALFFALLMVAVITRGFRLTGPWDSILALLLVLFLGTWAIGVWVAPIGPTVGEVAWVPFLIAAVLLALLLAAIPKRDRTIVLTPTPAEAREGASEEAGLAVGALFWILVVVLLVLVFLPMTR